MNNRTNLCSGPAGLRAGGVARAVLRRGKGAGVRAGRPAAGVRPYPLISLLAGILALFAVLAAPLAAQAATGRIINRAFLNTTNLTAPVESDVTVTLSRTAEPPKIELLQYAPTLPTAERVMIQPTWYRTASNPAAPFAEMPAPSMVGSSSTLNLAAPVPIAPAVFLHKCDPIFVRVTDAASDLDPNVAETVLVTISDPGTGDTEVLRLTETGPDTGVFTGFIQSAGGACRNNPAPGAYSGYLPVSDASQVTATYSSAEGGDSVTSVAVVDPFGRMFNSVTGQPVDGAEITLIDARTNGEATVYGDDGVSLFPARVTTGGTATDVSGRRYDFPPGQYRFPFVKPGTYRFKVKPAPGFAPTSTVTDAVLQGLPGGPFALTTGSRLDPFTVNPGPNMHIDIPVDPLPAALWMQKSAGKSIVAIGDFVPYQLDLQNNSDAATATGVSVTDVLPIGFRYRKGSTVIGGKGAADPAISADGRTLTFTLRDLAAKESVTIRYVVEIAAGAHLGEGINYATARSYRATSNTAQASVQVQSDFFNSQSIIMGRIERGPCGLEWDEGVEGIRVFLEDGTFVNSDKRGMFHFEGVKPGTHVVQLDLDSLPEGFQVYSCNENNRFAGRSFSQFVDVQGGTMWRANFRIGKADDAALYEKMKAERAEAQRKLEEEARKVEEEKRLAKERERQAAEAAAKKAKEEEEEDASVEADDWATPAAAAAPVVEEPEQPVDEWADPPAGKEAPKAAPPVKQVRKEPVSLELRSALANGAVIYTPTVQLAAVPLKNKGLVVELPEGLVYRRGSATGNGFPLADPKISGRTLCFDLDLKKEDTKATLGFVADFAPDAKDGRYVTRAAITYATEQGETERKASAENVLVRSRTQERGTTSIVVRPTFNVFDDQLSARDKKTLDDAIRKIREFAEGGQLELRQLQVVGHTDSMPISKKSRHIYRDNTALSLGRAKSVARYLQEQMGLKPEQISASGKGESAPVATNKTPEGRALNRRVEVFIVTDKVVDRVSVEMTKDASGVQSELLAVEMPEAPPAQPPERAATGAAEGSAWPPVPVWPPVVIPGAAGAGAMMSVALPAAAEVTCLFPQAAPKAEEEKAKEQAPEEPRLTEDGIISPADGSFLPDPISAVRVVADSKLTPQVLVDGVEVPAERIGFTLRDNKSGKTLYSYIGVNFGVPGIHTVKLLGKDPFGNVRLEKTAKVTRVGAISAIHFIGAEGNVADGKTPVRMKLELLDAAGVPFRYATDLDVLEGNLKPLKQANAFPDGSQEKGAKVHVDKDGYALFQPVNASGPYRTLVGAGKATCEADTYVQPKMRDWVLVGLGEGTVGYNAVSGHMENFRSSGMDENIYEDGRIAFYGKGTIQGKWLLTMAYDTAKKSTGSTGNSLFQTINPESYYTLYGDASQQQYDAPTAKKLYLKIEREQFYALFGDFDTGLTVTELSRYSRRMNGVKAEWQGKYVEANVFGSNTDQAYARDEIQGNGTSGLYHLSKKEIVANSEKITIQVRDQFRSEVIYSSRVLSRFVDYSIDYDSGTIFFKEPVFSKDEAFHPIFIVAEYEVKSAGSDAVTAGGRVGTRLLDNRVRAGFTYIHEGQVTGSGNSYGVDASAKLPAGIVVRGEAAQTDTRFAADARHGNAYLAEVMQTSQQFTGKAYYREQDPGFGLGQQNGSETGTRKAGAEGSYKINDQYTVAGQAYRQYNLATGAVQDIVEEKLNYTNGAYNAHIGGRYASDTLGDGSHQVSNQLTTGASWLTLDRRLTLHADHDQSLGGNNNASYPTRTVFGADYKLTEKVMVTGQQEFTSGSGASTNSTRLGFLTTPWVGAATTTTMGRESNENGERMFALFGLKQSWKITDRWSVDGGLDRSQTVSNSKNYSFNVNVPPASGSTEDFTAVSLGSSYMEKKWSWNNRLEYRTATSEDKWGIVSAFVGEPAEGWGWSARLQMFNTDSDANGKSVNDDLRMGLVYRPLQSRWIILDRLDFIYSKQDAISSRQESKRVVNNLNANVKLDARTELSLQYGAKYNLDTIDGAQYSGYTDLIGLEGRYDITKAWDIGARASMLHSWEPGQVSYSTGLSVGYNVVQNAWVSLGYNVVGFTDKDFSASDYTAQGPYIHFRFKFDQNSVKDAVKWLNQ